MYISLVLILNIRYKTEYANSHFCENIMFLVNVCNNNKSNVFVIIVIMDSV